MATAATRITAIEPRRVVGLDRSQRLVPHPGQPEDLFDRRTRPRAARRQVQPGERHGSGHEPALRSACTTSTRGPDRPFACAVRTEVLPHHVEHRGPLPARASSPANRRASAATASQTRPSRRCRAHTPSLAGAARRPRRWASRRAGTSPPSFPRHRTSCPGARRLHLPRWARRSPSWRAMAEARTRGA